MAHNYKQRMIETKRKSKNSKTVRNITKLRMRLDEMKGTTQNYSKHYAAEKTGSQFNSMFRDQIQRNK